VNDIDAGVPVPRQRTRRARAVGFAGVGLALLGLLVSAMWWWPASAPFPAENAMGALADVDEPVYVGWSPPLQADEPLLRVRPIVSEGMRTRLFICRIEQPDEGGYLFGVGDAEMIEEVCAEFKPAEDVGWAPDPRAGYEMQLVVEMVAVEPGPQHVCGVEMLRRTGWLVQRDTPSMTATIRPEGPAEVSDEELEASYRHACGRGR
jgi:hypothetical protein